jgi:AAA family ATP:ADP antiporter
MSSRLTGIIRFFLDVEKHERLKVFLLTVGFFCVIGGYTLAKELKDSIFVSTVGREYMPWAKMLSMIVLIPAILIYSRLVDVLRRYQLLVLYSVLYGIGGLICAYYLGHPTIGLDNTDTSPYRLFGWILYFFIEGYSPFVVSVFWAFTNSITSPEGAKNNYTVMIAGSKIGGMITAAFAWWLLSRRRIVYTAIELTDVTSHQVLLAVSSLLLLIVPIVIYIMMKKVPGKYLHGYEAVYKAEKKREDEEGLTGGTFGVIRSMMSGLTMFVRYPYVLGMFGMIFFWEIVNVVLQYIRLGVGKSSTNNVAELSSFLFGQVFYVHLAGFFIVLFGTRAIIAWLGERKSLMAVPILTGFVLVHFLTRGTAQAIAFVYVMIRSINYAFAYPLRESLYIPTTKEVKFKSKSWIDAFGAKVAKGCGAFYNVATAGFAESLASIVHMGFFGVIILLWVLTAHLLGRRFERAVARNEIIGEI